MATTSARARELFRALRERVRAIPGVERVALAAIPLLGNGGWTQWMTVEGYKTAEDENVDPFCNAVSPGYFATIGVPIIAGRDFEERDAAARGKPRPSRSSARASRSGTSRMAAPSACVSAWARIPGRR